MSTTKMPWPDLTPYNLMMTVMHDASGNRALVIRPADFEESAEKSKARVDAMVPKLNQVCQKVGDGRQIKVAGIRDRFLVFTGPMVRNQGAVNTFFGKLFPKAGQLNLTLEEIESAEVVAQAAKARFAKPSEGPDAPFDRAKANEAMPAGVAIDNDSGVNLLVISGVGTRELKLPENATNQDAQGQIQDAIKEYLAALVVTDLDTVNEYLVTLNRDLQKANLPYWQKVTAQAEQAYYESVRGDLELLDSYDNLNDFDLDDLKDALDTLGEAQLRQGKAVRTALLEKHAEIQKWISQIEDTPSTGEPLRDNVQESSGDNGGNEGETLFGYPVIGKNTEGETVVEDENGVRAHVSGSILVWESVGMVPTRSGYKAQVDVDNRGTSHLTAEEALGEEPESLSLGDRVRASYEVSGETGRNWVPIELDVDGQTVSWLARNRDPEMGTGGPLELVSLVADEAGEVKVLTQRLTMTDDIQAGGLPYPAPATMKEAWYAAGFAIEGEQSAPDSTRTQTDGDTLSETPDTEDSGDDDTAESQTGATADDDGSENGAVSDADDRTDGTPGRAAPGDRSTEPTDGDLLEQREQSGTAGAGADQQDAELDGDQGRAGPAEPVGRPEVDAERVAGHGAGSGSGDGDDAGETGDVPDPEQTVSGQPGADGNGDPVSGRDAGGNEDGVQPGIAGDLFGDDGESADQADDADGRPGTDGSDQSDATASNPGDAGVSAGGGTGESEPESGSEASAGTGDGLPDADERGERDQDAGQGADEQPDWEGLGDAIAAEDFARPERFVAESDEDTRSAAARLSANLEALNLLHQLETEGSEPTMEERGILAGYSGFGGIHPDLFKEYAWGLPKWVQAGAESLKEMRASGVISFADYETLRSTVLNAHYSHSGIIQPMWEALDKMGVPLERTLEPSAGSLNFKAHMPESAADKVKYFTAVEYDPLTARIAQAIHPDARVIASAFEKTKFPDNFFDCAISNIPFGDYTVFDPEHPERKNSIHNQFFLKGLDKVRPGGVVAFVTSSYVLDGADTSVRQQIMDRAHVVGAYRLPMDTFKKSTGTEVVTDILFLQKKGNFEPSYEPLNILDTAKIDAPLQAGSPLEWNGEVYQPGEMIGGNKINQVYVDHPERVLGELAVVTTQHGPKMRVLGGGTIAEQREALREAMASMPENVAIGERETLTPDQIAQTIKNSTQQNRELDDLPGALRFDGQKFWAKEVTPTGEIEERQVDPPKSSHKRMALTIKAMESLSALMAMEATARTADENAELEQLRAAARQDAETLIKASDGKKPIAGAGKKLLDADGRSALLRGAVLVDNENNWSLADVYHQRTVEPMTEAPTKADTLDDAVALSLAYTARLSETYIEQLLSHLDNAPTAEQIRNTLVNQGKAFIDPANNELVERTMYLSGNLGPKLELAQNVAASDPSFSVNVDALNEAMPEPLKPSEIKVSLDAFWLPEDVMNEFLKDGLGINTEGNAGAKVYFDTHKRHWRLMPSAERGSPSMKRIAEAQKHVAQSRWGTSRKNVFELLEFGFTNTTPKVLDPIPGTEPTRYEVNTEESLNAQAKHEEIVDAFNRWIFKSPARAQRLADIYNTQFNTWVLHEPDGSHMVYPGMADSWVPRKHQNDFIWRAVSGPNCMTAHVVGAGKTMQLIGSAIRGKQMGRWNKPLCVVPNHMLEQFANDAQSIFPGARVLAMTAADARADNRAAFAARCAMGDWDLVICTHSVFEKITVPKDFEARMITAELAKLRASMENDQERSYKEKEIEKAIKQLEQRLERALQDVNDEKENVLNMSQIGIDWIGVDEAHYYKNLQVDTAQQIPGVSNASSKRATNMLLKTQYLHDLHGGPYGVMMATGTPVSNSVTECYTFQRYLRPDLLEGMGIQNFNDWMGLFGEVKHGMEMKPEGGGYQMKSRLSRFKNIPELVKTVRTFVDFKTREDLQLPTPNVTSETVVAPQSPFMKNFMQYIEARARTVRNADSGGNSSAERIAHEIRQRLNKANDKTVINKDTGEVDEERLSELADDILLTIATDGRKASLDPRLIHPGLEDFEDSKVNKCVRKCVELYHRFDEQKAAQMIFCDFSSPTGKGIFNVYDDMKKKLIDAGIPEDEIAFIHDAKSDSDKEALFAKVRSGEVRFLLGSTQKMGVGTNVQERLVAMHQLDPPWKPADIEQRLGRMDRQGNMFDEVFNFTYVTEDSFDLFMWETLNRKLRMTQQAMRRPEDCARDINEDIEIGYEDILAVTTGNPAIRDYMETRQALDKFKRMHDNHVDNQADLAQQIHNQEKKIENISGFLDAKIREQELVNSKLPLHIEFDDPQPALRDGPACTAGGLDGLADALKHMAERAPAYRTVTVGKMGGLELRMARMASEPKLILVRETGQEEDIFKFLSQNDLFSDEEKFNADGTPNKNADVNRMAAKALVRTVHKIATDNGIDGTREALANAKENLENMQADLGAPFEYEQEMEETRTRFRELSEMLGDEIDSDKPMDPTPVVEMAAQIYRQTGEHPDLPEIAEAMATNRDIAEHLAAQDRRPVDDLDNALNDDGDDLEDDASITIG
ncbi:MAG: helicase domain-containing protein [Marinobacter sp. T13-3]|nr:MAG: helicase domain-containing protein [Marinobacter sp. T13-3]